MKIKVTLLPLAIDTSKPTLHPERIKLLVDGEPLHKYLLSETPEDAIKKICSEYLGYTYEWLSIDLCDFMRHENHFEAIYFCQFPASYGWKSKGNTIRACIDEEIKQIGEHYFDIISRHSSRRYS